jgi:hypothetical protein
VWIVKSTMKLLQPIGRVVDADQSPIGASPSFPAVAPVMAATFAPASIPAIRSMLAMSYSIEYFV